MTDVILIDVIHAARDGKGRLCTFCKRKVNKRSLVDLAMSSASIMVKAPSHKPWQAYHSSAVKSRTRPEAGLEE